MTFQTIQVSSCLSIQGECVEALASGEVVVRDGRSIYRGQPIRCATGDISTVTTRPRDIVAPRTREHV